MQTTLDFEFSYTVAGREYTLRPTLALFHKIEKQTGYTLHELARSCTHEQANIILQTISTGLRVEHHATTLAQDFLNYALRDVTIFNWQEMFTLYVGMMGRPAAEFWSITPAEYLLAIEGFCQLRGIAPEAAGMPATSQELAEMIRRFG